MKRLKGSEEKSHKEEKKIWGRGQVGRWVHGISVEGGGRAMQGNAMVVCCSLQLLLQGCGSHLELLVPSRSTLSLS
jgi:hypothetical protein